MRKYEMSVPDLHEHTKKYLLDMETLIAGEAMQMAIRTGKEPSLHVIVSLALSVAYQNGVIDGIHSATVAKEHPAHDYLVKLRALILPVHEKIERDFKREQEQTRIAKDRLN